MSVKPGVIEKPDPIDAKKLKKQDQKLREKMVSRKHQRLFKGMVNARRNDAKEIWLLRKKRRNIDAEKQKNV